MFCEVHLYVLFLCIFQAHKKLLNSKTANIHGSLVRNGFCEMEITVKAQDSTANKLANLVTQAFGHKTRISNLIDRFIKIYIPIVLCVAIALILVPIFNSDKRD